MNSLAGVHPGIVRGDFVEMGLAITLKFSGTRAALTDRRGRTKSSRMMFKTIGSSTLISTLVAVALGGCAASKNTAVTPATPATPATAGAAGPVSLAQYEGLYNGDWGVLVLKQVGDELWGAYAHDAGAVRGTVTGTTFTGHWCEDPSRAGDADSGMVSFKFGPDDKGVMSIDGIWGYGNAQPSNEDWNITMQPGQTDATLEARFADSSKFCPGM